MFGIPQNPDKTHVSADTVALRDRYAPALRSWGMVITVTDDPDDDNNADWKLVKGESTESIADNDNWVKVTAGTGGSAGGAEGAFQYNDNGSFAGVGKYDSENSTVEFPVSKLKLTGFTNGGFGYEDEDGNTKYFERRADNIFSNGFSLNVLSYTDVVIPNNSVFTVECEFQAINDTTPGSNGFVYKLIRSFKKNNAGAISVIGTTTVVHSGNDTGMTITTSTLTPSVGNIDLNFAFAAIADQFNGTAIVKVYIG